MIGSKKIPLKVIQVKKGNIYKFISKKEIFFKKFGEIYFSEIKFNKIKGWNYHKKNKCQVAVISGKVRFSFLKKNKKSFISKTIILSSKNYSMIVIPPKVYFSFKGLNKFNLIVNFLENIHDPKESLKFKEVNKIKIKD